MTAAIWTVLGVWAATVLGMRFYLGAKIDALENRMDAGFDRVEARFDAVDARLDALNARLDAHLDRHAS